MSNSPVVRESLATLIASEISDAIAAHDGGEKVDCVARGRAVASCAPAATAQQVAWLLTNQDGGRRIVFGELGTPMADESWEPILADDDRGFTLAAGAAQKGNAK